MDHAERMQASHASGGQLNKRLLQEKAELGTRQKELERWEQKVYDKKEELTDLKAQMREIKDNQARLADLRKQLKGLQPPR